jgi:hypothetical protein
MQMVQCGSQAAAHASISGRGFRIDLLQEPDATGLSTVTAQSTTRPDRSSGCHYLRASACIFLHLRLQPSFVMPPMKDRFEFGMTVDAVSYALTA